MSEAGSLEALLQAAQEAPEPAAALLGRALGSLGAPEALWPGLAAASAGWGSLDGLLEQHLGAPEEGAWWARLEGLYMAARFCAAAGRGQRRAAGVFYTPPEIARWLAATTLGRRPRGAVVDLACGFGALLSAAVEVGRGGWTPRGVDVDPWAVEVTRARLWRAGGERAADVAALLEGVRCGDGLFAEVEPADAALGNPPFGSAIQQETARSADEDARLRAAFPAVARGAFDLAFLFAARSAASLRPGGRYGLILPRSVLSLASGEGLRGWLAAEAPPTHLWAPTTPHLFPGADVLVALLCGGRGARRRGGLLASAAPPAASGGPEGGLAAVGRLPRGAGPWAALLAPQRELLAGLQRPPAPLIPLAEAVQLFGGAATGTAYRLRERVEEDGGPGEGPGLRLITTGLIDRYGVSWGARPCRFLRGTFQAPRWPALPPDGEPEDDVARAQRRQRVPKLLVAGLSRVLEAVADFEGALGGVVSTWVITAPALSRAELLLLEGVLNAPLLSLIYMTRFSGKALSGGNTTVGRRELGQLPLPAEWRALATGDPPGSVTSGLFARRNGAGPPRDGGAPTGGVGGVGGGAGWVWGLCPGVEAERRLLGGAVVEALGGRLAGEAPSAEADALVGAAVSRLYGFDAAGHAEILAWFSTRCATLDAGEEGA